MTLGEIFNRSPIEALEKTFAQSRELHWSQDKAFMWQSSLGVNCITRYGSFRWVSRDELARRSHQLEFWDGAVSVYWTDALYDPKKRTDISL